MSCIGFSLNCSKNIAVFPRVLIVLFLKSFNLIVERFGSFGNSKKINYQGFNFLWAIFTISACPREKRPIILLC